MQSDCLFYFLTTSKWDKSSLQGSLSAYLLSELFFSCSFYLIFKRKFLILFYIIGTIITWLLSYTTPSWWSNLSDTTIFYMNFVLILLIYSSNEILSTSPFYLIDSSNSSKSSIFSSSFYSPRLNVSNLLPPLDIKLLFIYMFN
jgi:hypothetical protein